MPTFVGGTCSCPGGCVGDVPNDCAVVKGSDIVQQEQEELEEDDEGAEEQKGGGGGGWFSGWF